MKNVEFVSYTGKWPNLCRGTLTLKINEKEVKFGKDYDTNENYSSCFWKSGGRCGFHNGHTERYIDHDKWYINASEIPEAYRKYAEEIEEVFNDNVEHGCCGGCL